MPLFQESIIKKHLLTIDEQVIESAYNEYKRVYSAEKIKNIKIAKEEQYQEGFIKDVFGSVLGYSVYPESPYNIETEKKNETNSKKADGAILKDEKVVGVIELKDNKTKNLDAVKDQAFGYKNNHKECSYVISSNFHKLRFYIDDATDYEEFDLYNLDKETFKRFYLYLRKEGLLDKNLPKLLREETKFHEEEISKKLYKDYSNFKRSFFENAERNNPQFDKLELFKKSQKFLDRILFLLFAEDKGLVGTNSIVNIVEKWSGADDDYYQPLYEMVNKYFGHLYRGYTYQKTGEVIPQFGGELFAPDDVLETLKIDDDVLKNDLLILSKYDFNTDVDVNILGHIFEHSLNEVDDVEAELRGDQLDKTKSKRKKDGVFYTPKYITKYIVDNTLGKLCGEKKAELKLDQDIAIFEYQKVDGKLNEKGKDLYERLNAYKAWLLTIKVCDPACGSGAFLNQALSFFIEEHKFVDDIIAELTNTPLRLFDTDLQILENNIFGVDINEESIEIAKLSLWLRTALPGRKLSDLSNNIKCGNSLIDDPVVAGDKAFNWEIEFPTVFEKGGFDVVIGNPPYVGTKQININDRNYFWLKYKDLLFSEMDLYEIFLYMSVNKLIIENGRLGFITPNSYYTNISFKFLRNYLLNETCINSIIDFPYRFYPFNDVNTETSIIVLQKNRDTSNLVNFKVIDKSQQQAVGGMMNVYHNEIDIAQSLISEKYDGLIIINVNPILNKIISKDKKFGDFLDLHKGWMSIPEKTILVNRVIEKGIFSKDEIKMDIDLSNQCSLYLEGRDIHRYYIDDVEKYVFTAGMDKKTKSWHINPKIILQRIVGQNKNKIFASLDFNNHIIFPNANLVNLKNENDDVRFFLAILNSTLISYFYNLFFGESNTNLTKLAFESIPIPEISGLDQSNYIEKANLILNLYSEFNHLNKKFSILLISDFNSLKMSKKIGEYYNLTWSDFEKELQKNKITLLGVHKDDWFDRFERFKKQALEIKSQIDQTDKEIDRMVYELYGLTEEEIQIVENS